MTIFRHLAVVAAMFILPTLAVAQTADVSCTTPAVSGAVDTLVNVDIVCTNNGPDDVGLTGVGTNGAGPTQVSGPTLIAGTPAPLVVGQSFTTRWVYDTTGYAAGSVLTGIFYDFTFAGSDPNPSNNTHLALALTVTGSSDVSITKTGPGTATAGLTVVNYLVRLANAGPDDAVVSWSDTLPPSMGFVAIAPWPGSTCTTPAVGATGTVSCSITLAAGATNIDFPMSVKPFASTPDGTVAQNTATITPAPGVTDPDLANNTSTTPPLTVSALADVAVTKTGPATAFSNTDITYTITVTNNGPSDAQATSLLDTIPAGTSLVSLVQDTGSADGTALAAGASRTYTFVVHVDPSVSSGSIISNTATITSTTTDPDLSNNAGTQTTSISAQADLSVAKSGPAGVTVGSNIAYAVVVSSAGPSTATSVVMTDPLPANTTFVSLGQTGAPFVCTAPAVGGTGTVTCTNASFASTDSTTVTITVATTAAASGTTVSNTATVASAASDPNMGNNSSTLMTAVAASADLAVSKSAAGPVTAGSNIVYTIGVTNAGPSAATGVSLSDTLPAGTTFVSLTSPAGFTCTTPAVGGTGTVTCTNPSVASGASPSFTLVAATTAALAGTMVSNTATVTSATPDPSAVNNSATSTTAVGAVTTFSAASPTGTGTITATFTGGGATCGFTTAQFIPVTGDPASPPGPAPAAFPHGLFDFTLGGCNTASAITMTITYPQALAAGTQYWKYGPTAAVPAGSWYVMPATIAGNTVTFTITDGGLGDDDLTADGTIVDQGGPGNPGPPGSANAIPTLGEWMLMLLATLLLASGLAAARRRERSRARR